MIKCECGRQKTKKATCCASCSFLDGLPLIPSGPNRDHEIVSILRMDTSGLTVGDLAERTCRHKVAVMRTLRRLSTRGRVLRREVDAVGATYVALYFLTTPRNFSVH